MVSLRYELHGVFLVDNCVIGDGSVLALPLIGGILVSDAHQNTGRWGVLCCGVALLPGRLFHIRLRKRPGFHGVYWGEISQSMTFCCFMPEWS